MKVDSAVSRQIDNEIYHSANWWSPDDIFYLLKSSLNPCRVGYFDKLIKYKLQLSPQNMTALEVGCGGGLLTEDIALMGFETTGIDPSNNSISIAAEHAQLSGLNIRYETGSAENLPYANASFDVVFCCDVLEHVNDLPKAISEIARVTKKGGVFFYDTINRTIKSNIVMIKMAQEWKRYAFAPQRAHVWKMFIKPKELFSLFKQTGFENEDLKGISPNGNPLKLLGYFRKKVKGEWNYAELSKHFYFVESNDTSVSYMGYATKK